MRAGSLNKRITIYQLVTGSPSVDSFGQPNTSWEELDTVWAAVEPLSGREFWAQQQIQSEITSRIRIRYRSDVAVGMKIAYSSRTYIIKYMIDNLEEHKELWLMCTDGVVNA